MFRLQFFGVAETINCMILQVFLGENLLPYLVLAIGGAMIFGPAAAILKPRNETQEGDLEKPPLLRSIVFMVMGAVAALWAFVSLIT